MAANTSRHVFKSVLAKGTPEGAGAFVYRSIGSANLRNLSPFLMLDDFAISRGAGFPDHPHTGMSTVTLLLDGMVQHEDFKGSKGTLSAGDLQWMTAGKGIIHAEMPYFPNEDSPNPKGLQLWLDLPESHRNIEPSYQELKDKDIPHSYPSEGVDVKVIAGESHGVTSPIKSVTPAWYFDIRMKPGSKFRQPLPVGWTAFVYQLTGTVLVGEGNPTESKEHTTLVLSQFPGENDVYFEAPKAEGQSEETRFVLIAGQPLDQQVYQAGPMVQGSAAAIREAFMDYQFSRNGFEGADRWRSEIGGQ